MDKILKTTNGFYSNMEQLINNKLPKLHLHLSSCPILPFQSWVMQTVATHNFSTTEGWNKSGTTHAKSLQQEHWQRHTVNYTNDDIVNEYNFSNKLQLILFPWQQTSLIDSAMVTPPKKISTQQCNSITPCTKIWYLQTESAMVQLKIRIPRE